MIRKLSFVVLSALVVTLTVAGAWAPLVAAVGLDNEPRIERIEVHPASIELNKRVDYSQLVLTGVLENGERVDLTRRIEVESGDALVQVSERGLVRPLANGSSELRLRVSDQRVSVPIKVSGLDSPLHPDFVQDIMPLLTKAGCNSGGCHGSAQGKNGFKLSLRGYDPEFDYAALTDDLAGRRFNPAAPNKSLFLLKPTGAVPHEGGQVLSPDSHGYALLEAWARDGAPFHAEAARPTSIRIVPEEPTLALPGSSQQFAVLARYPDGNERDVSAEAFIETSNTEVLSVDDEGLVTALRRGEGAVMARYEGCYAATRTVVMGDRSGFAWREVPQWNEIDTLVQQKLRRIQVQAGELCTDAEFLRRVHLDLTGRPPTAKQVRVFLMDRRDTRLKRDELIDRLIGSAAFVDYWTNKWADLLLVNSKFLGEEGAERFRVWVQSAIASNMPYDEFVREILGATGSTYENPAAAYYKVLRKPDEVMENTTQLFLGVRFNCNKCHDHPFERWTRSDHWELAAWFGRVGRMNAKGSPLMPRIGVQGDERVAFEELISDLTEGEIEDPETGVTIAPDFPYDHGGVIPVEASRREQLVSWVTSPENPYFALSYTNRLWSYFLGVGLIDPVDDIRASNPPSNPELLEFLTGELMGSGFDVRHLMRLICQSYTYQQSIATNEWNVDDGLNYSHAMARRLPAEVMFDALHQATGSRSKLPGVPAGTLATELVDASIKAPDGFLDLFGRPPRESACECERGSGMSLGQALNLVNGPTVADAVLDPDNAIAELVAYERDPGAIIEELYLSFLCRAPTTEEQSSLVPTFDVNDPENRFALDPTDEQALMQGLEQWAASFSVPDWRTVEYSDLRSAAGAALTAAEDGSVLLSDSLPEKDTYTVVCSTDLAGVTGIRLEVLPDESLPAKGPGRAENGNFVLSEFRAFAFPLADPASAAPIVLQNATADYSQGSYSVKGAIDSKPASGWAVSNRFGQAHEAVFETKENVGKGPTLFVITLDQQYGAKHMIGKFRISVTNTARPVRHHGLPEPVAAALMTPADQRSEAQFATIYTHYLSTKPKLRDKIRLGAAQDLAWALANSPAFLFNR